LADCQARHLSTIFSGCATTRIHIVPPDATKTPAPPPGKTHPGNEGARLYTKTGACAATAAGPVGRYIGAPTRATSVGAEAAGFPGRFPRRAVCTGVRRCPAAGGRRNETTRWQCGCTRGGRRPLATRRPPPAIPTRLPTRLRATGLLYRRPQNLVGR